MKTCSIKPTNIKKDWVTIDCTNRSLGRVATEIASILRGKHKPYFVPHLDCGDHVIALNIKNISLSGNKWELKKYYRHSGYIGGLKECSARELFTKSPEEMMLHAVKGMLPKNKLGRKIIKNFKPYSGNIHNHEAQKPSIAKARLIKGE